MDFFFLKATVIVVVVVILRLLILLLLLLTWLLLLWPCLLLLIILNLVVANKCKSEASKVSVVGWGVQSYFHVQPNFCVEVVLCYSWGCDNIHN